MKIYPFFSSLILFQRSESITVYCVPFHMIFSAFCFVLFFSSYTLSSFAPTRRQNSW